MVSGKAKRPFDGLTQAQVAAALGKSTDTIAQWASKGMPGSRGKYCLPDIVRWAESQGPWRAKPRLDDDPLLAADVDSPGLERYRLAKAEIAELDAAERRGSLLSRDKARDVLGRWASLLRRCGERIGKRFGAEAAKALNDALLECQSVVDNELSTTEPANGHVAAGLVLGAEAGEGTDRSPHVPVG